MWVFYKSETPLKLKGSEIRWVDGVSRMVMLEGVKRL